ncbi:MAG: hypothetical protein ACYDEV_10720 [Acidiferrobacter sp.]
MSVYVRLLLHGEGGVANKWSQNDVMLPLPLMAIIDYRGTSNGLRRLAPMVSAL